MAVEIQFIWIKPSNLFLIDLIITAVNFKSFKYFIISFSIQIKFFFIFEHSWFLLFAFNNIVLNLVASCF